MIVIFIVSCENLTKVLKINELKEKKSLNIKEFFKSDYIASKDVNAWLCLSEVLK